MVQALAPTTRIDEAADNSDDAHSDNSSELRLSYLDDIPLRQRFPGSKPPTSTKPQPPLPSTIKPLTITLPAPSGHAPSCSVTDILRELKNTAKAKSDHTDTPVASLEETMALEAKTNNDAVTLATRFGGAQVEYTSSALQHKADAFVEALATSAIPSQPSPPLAHSDSSAPAALSQLPPNHND
ncbi:hypothetical protein AX14_011290 [Amanita brunnescens Koide BX004]|nr:hypothetical protein AX14_011290 [Amanita brunnescens Koide BX004]